MPETAEAGTPVAKITAAGVPLSFSTLSPPEMGDAICGLSLAVAGVGPALAENLPNGAWPTDVGPSDAWAVALDSGTGWYVLLTQDCDMVRSEVDEPTVWIAPLVLVDADRWAELKRSGYSSREWAYPGDKFTKVPAGQALVVDLAWVTSVLKGSLTAPGVLAVRALTGPNKADFSEWVAARPGRAPFPHDVVTKVLDPFYEVRKAAGRKLEKANSGGTASADARLVGSVARWYARTDGKRIDLLGELTGPLLSAQGWAADVAKDEVFEKARVTVEGAVLRKMNHVDAHSGFQIRLTIADLSQVSAASFVKFSLLLR